MFRFLFELFVGPAIDLKNATVGGGAYFGLVLVMSLIYLVFPFGPLILWCWAVKGEGLLALVIFGWFALCFGATSVDTWIKKLQQEVRNEPLRGKPLDDRIEGE